MKDSNLQISANESMRKLADQLVDYLANRYAGSPAGRMKVIKQKLSAAFAIGWNCGVDNYRESKN